ncbi:hypothetical protein EJ04DRAFT_538260 [Polyplosphaeria fusca]|uniref:Amino acid permease/ SLC12A domain-containing protein n=1 Tax=Polyplosphaeria fusca TaxID=682080 RepID=A0A9P4QPP5_9PLEO|nr:hypothetical protein EJ04DRAFT_538260 [Polyplosphaeria fusca]
MADERPLDRNPLSWEHFEHLDRVLGRPQLAGIGISGLVGAGLFVNSGSLISITGSLGGPIAYLVAAGIVSCVLYTTTEMVACRPITGAIIDFPHTFLDPAFGFAVAASYAIANICSMATLTAQSAELTALLRDPPRKWDIGVEAGINVGLVLLTTISQCLGVKLYGKIERIVMWFKICLLFLVCILMIVINAGDITSHAFPPAFKPVGFKNTTETGLRLTGVDDNSFGIEGPGGQFFAFLTAVSLAMFSCCGGEMVTVTAGEAKNPWKDVPIVMSFVYLVPMVLYPFILLSAGANVNYADPYLAKTWARGDGPLAQSPFVIAVQSSSLHGLPWALNLFFIISAYTAGNTALYVSSRTIFVLAQQYAPRKLADKFGKTNNGHTPIYSILLCSALSFLSLVGLSQYAFSQPRITLSQFYVSSIACIYVCLCVTFLKFKAGLDLLASRKLIIRNREIYVLSRNDRLYIERLFKSRWQPLTAYIGLVGCAFIAFWYGVPSIVILATKGSLTSTKNLKSTTALAFDVIGAYLGPILFAAFYFAYKARTHCRPVDIRDLTPENYVLEDLEFLEKSKPSTPRKFSDATDASERPDAIELGSPEEERAMSMLKGKRTARQNVNTSLDLSPGMMDNLEAQRAMEEDRKRVCEILERRPKKTERGFWRELWSFVVE